MKAEAKLVVSRNGDCATSRRLTNVLLKGDILSRVVPSEVFFTNSAVCQNISALQGVLEL